MSNRFLFCKNGGGQLLLLLALLLFSLSLKLDAQCAGPVIQLSCEVLDVTVCQRTPAIPTPPNCTGCSAVPLDCHSMQYVVRLSADDGVTDSIDVDALCFELSYTDLELMTALSFTGTASGMTRINKDATESLCSTVPLSINEATNSAAFSYGGGGTLPTIEFTRTQTNAPFYTELFTIVVDVYPTDIFELSCSFFRYADGDNGTCYYPNTYSPPAPDFIAPGPYQLELDEDANVLFLTDNPSYDTDNVEVTIPLRIRSNYMSPSAMLTVPYLDFLVTVESSAPIPPPEPTGASDYEVEISPSSGLNTFYIVKARLTGSPPTFSSSFGVLSMFSLKMERPNPQNMESTIDLNYQSGRFEGQFLTTPAGAIFCKKMSKGGSGDVIATFAGDAVCANSGLFLNVVGAAGGPTDDCGDLSATVSLGIPNNSPVRELRFVLDFDLTSGAFIDEANIINGLPCDLSNNLQSCIDSVGSSECYEVDGNSLRYCFKTSSGHEINYTGGTMTIPVTAVSGCIKNVTVREVAYYIVGQGTVTCVPDAHVTGFYVCSQEISGAIKSGPSGDGCWLEEVKVKIVATDNACNDHTEMTTCPSMTGSTAPYSYCVCDEGNYSITPENNDNPLNGVTTYDLVLMSKHILGVETFDSPYKFIAADINKSGSITSFDIVETRKLILGIDTVFSNNNSWRFVPKDLVFADTLNPFQKDFDLAITAEVDGSGIEYSFIYNGNTVNPSAADFVGIKVGDVNCTAVNCYGAGCTACGSYPQRPANPAERYALELPGISAKAGEVFILPVYAGSAYPLIAYQAGLHFDPSRFEFLSVSAGDVPGFTPDCLNLKEVNEGRIKALWISFDHESNYLQRGQVLFYVAMRAIADVRNKEFVLSTDNAVFENLGYTSDHLELPLQTRLRPGAEQREQLSGAPLSASCSPNPSSGAVELSIQSKMPAKARVFVFGPYGVRMYYRELDLGKGTHSLPIPEAADWLPGIYTWQIQAGAEKAIGRFVKQ